ncbi:hypothetical protein GF338_02240 [candidate division WOR-3 bacterium]|nr:hypothetical protein [candidate division WOR-3 bacterium]
MKYCWMVALFVIIVFSGCESVENNLDDTINQLDTTYFPLGLDYEWCYEYWNNGKCDTITISVKNISENSDKWIEYHLTGGSSDYFIDLSNPARIRDNKVILFDDFDTVSAIPDSNDLESNYVEYRYDTLHLFFDSLDGDYNYHYYTMRLKGIGVIRQGYSEWEFWPYGDKVKDRNYRLLYFLKGDTVWR